ncbi:hypothetical protein WDW37_05405 [Bdellovibrionota bacterium FG-1]
MSEFCEVQTFRGVGNLRFGWSPEEADAVIKTNSLGTILEKYMGVDYEPWQVSVFPKEDLAKTALALGYSKPGFHCFDSPQKVAEFLNKPQQSLPKEKADRIRAKIDALLKSPTEDATLSRVNESAGKLFACGTLSLSSALKCSDGIDQIRETMTQRLDRVDQTGRLFGFSLLPTIQTVLTDPRYMEGVRLAALKIGSRMNVGPGKSTGDLFKDIYTSFIAAGLSTKDAHEFTWNVMGVISSGGASTFIRLHHLDSECAPPNPVVEGLSLISLAVPLLDIQAASSGHFYPINWNAVGSRLISHDGVL